MLIIWWCLCVAMSLVLEEGICYGQSIILAKLCWPLTYFILYSKAKLVYCSRYFLTSYFCIPLWWKTHLFFLVLVLEGFLGRHRTIQLQLLQPFWLEHRLGLLWYWMVCLGNEPRSIWHFWDCTKVLYLTLLLTMRITLFLLRDSCPQ